MSRDGWEALSETRRLFWMSGSGRETLSDVRVWSGGTPGSPGLDWRYSRMTGNVREAHQDVRE